jgi:hypothetical protein
MVSCGRANLAPPCVYARLLALFESHMTFVSTKEIILAPELSVNSALRPILAVPGRFFACLLKLHFLFSSCLTVERFF